jgi:hypothetical protein
MLVWLGASVKEQNEVDRLALVGQFAEGGENLAVGVEVKTFDGQQLLNVGERFGVAQDATQNAQFGGTVVGRQAAGERITHACSFAEVGNEKTTGGVRRWSILPHFRV